MVSRWIPYLIPEKVLGKQKSTVSHEKILHDLQSILQDIPESLPLSAILNRYVVKNLGDKTPE